MVWGVRLGGLSMPLYFNPRECLGEPCPIYGVN